MFVETLGFLIKFVDCTWVRWGQTSLTSSICSFVAGLGESL